MTPMLTWPAEKMAEETTAARPDPSGRTSAASRNPLKNTSSISGPPTPITAMLNSLLAPSPSRSDGTGGGRRESMPIAVMATTYSPANPMLPISTVHGRIMPSRC